MSHEVAEPIIVDEATRLQIEKNQGAIRLLRTWIELSDESEDEGSLEDLKTRIDENRSDDRKHFE